MKTVKIILFALLLMLVLNACWRKKDAKETKIVAPHTISTKDLPSLVYLPFHTDRDIVNLDIKDASYGYDSENPPVVPSSLITFGAEDVVSYYLIHHENEQQYIIIRHETDGMEPRYYYGQDKDDKILVNEITPVVHRFYGVTENRLFRAGISETGEYEVDISVVESNEYGFSRKNLWNGNGMIPRRNIYRDELMPDYSYYDYIGSGRPALSLRTKELQSTDYIDLDSLWNFYRLKYYKNTTPDVGFHLLPAYYKNHDLLVERSKDRNGYTRYLLYNVGLETDGIRRGVAGWIVPEPLIELTPQRYDSLTGEKIVTDFEIFAQNIILVYEEHLRGENRHKYLYSVYPGNNTDETNLTREYYKYGSYHTWLADTIGETYFHDMPEVAVVKDYLQWYVENSSEIYALDMVLEPDEERDCYEVDLDACGLVVRMLQGSGFVSEKYVSYWRNYFNEAYAYNKQNPEEGPADYFAHDIFLLTMESEPEEAIRDGHIMFTMVRRISPDRSVVSVSLAYHDMVFELSRHNDKWLIDGFGLNTLTFYATEEPLILFMTDNEIERLRALEHYNIEHEDKFYYEPIRNSIPEFHSNGICVDLFDPLRYHSIRFANGALFELEDFYYLDAIVYIPGKAPVVVRNLEQDDAWNEIREYFEIF